MAYEEDALEHERASWKPSAGLAVAVPDPVQNPGLPPHRARMTDQDPAAMKRAVRTVYTLFYLSLAGSIWAIAAYMLFYAAGSGLGAIGSTLVYAHAGWQGVCALGAAVSLAALLFWRATLARTPSVPG